MNQYVKEIVRELFNSFHKHVIFTKRYVYFRDYNDLENTINICRMDRCLFESLNRSQYIPERVLATMPKEAWEELIKWW